MKLFNWRRLTGRLSVDPIGVRIKASIFAYWPCRVFRMATIAIAAAQVVFAQDAAPADRNEVNSTARPGSMSNDSPVRFPDKGGLPTKYPPDLKVKHAQVEEGYSMFPSPCRSVMQIDRIQGEMPRGRFTPPPSAWENLSRVQRILTEGGELHIMAVGDSIVNDTMRSGWVGRLADAYPKASIRATVYVRGGGGCQHFKENGRVAANILPRKPDLILISGISQKDVTSVAEVIHQIRAGLPEVEFLLMTGAFGTVDPRSPEALAASLRYTGSGPYGKALKQLAGDERCAYLDMTSPWAEYIRSTGLHPHFFYRDVVHANEWGEQILAKILMAFWTAGVSQEKR